MKIALGCDHVSTDLKYILMDYLRKRALNVLTLVLHFRRKE